MPGFARESQLVVGGFCRCRIFSILRAGFSVQIAISSWGDVFPQNTNTLAKRRPLMRVITTVADAHQAIEDLRQALAKTENITEIMKIRDRAEIGPERKTGQERKTGHH